MDEIDSGRLSEILYGGSGTGRQQVLGIGKQQVLGILNKSGSGTVEPISGSEGKPGFLSNIGRKASEIKFNFKGLEFPSYKRINHAEVLQDNLASPSKRPKAEKISAQTGNNATGEMDKIFSDLGQAESFDLSEAQKRYLKFSKNENTKELALEQKNFLFSMHLQKDPQKTIENNMQYFEGPVDFKNALMEGGEKSNYNLLSKEAKGEVMSILDSYPENQKKGFSAIKSKINDMFQSRLDKASRRIQDSQHFESYIDSDSSTGKIPKAQANIINEVRKEEPIIKPEDKNEKKNQQVSDAGRPKGKSSPEKNPLLSKDGGLNLKRMKGLNTEDAGYVDNNLVNEFTNAVEKGDTNAANKVITNIRSKFYSGKKEQLNLEDETVTETKKLKGLSSSDPRWNKVDKLEKRYGIISPKLTRTQKLLEAWDSQDVKFDPSKTILKNPTSSSRTPSIMRPVKAGKDALPFTKSISRLEAGLGFGYGFVTDSPKVFGQTGLIKESLNETERVARKKAEDEKQSKNGYTEKQKAALKKKKELDDAYTAVTDKYSPKWDKKTFQQTQDSLVDFRNRTGNKFPAGQDGKDDPANALMSDYDEAVKARREAVKNKDEKAYAEASKKMHEIAGSYSEKTGHDFLPDRQYWKRGKVSRYGGYTSKDLASFAARNPNSIEANIINNINNGNGLENLENLAGGYQDTIENLKRYGFDAKAINTAASDYIKLSEAAAENGLSTQAYETIQKGGKTEAYNVIDALKQEQTTLGNKKGNILGKDPEKMQDLPKGELDNLDAIAKRQEELKTSIDKAEGLFNDRFSETGGLEGYEKLKEAERIHDRGIAEISDDLPVEKPTKTDIKEKGKYRAGFRKRMNEKLGYGRGGNIGWGKVAKAGVAAALVAGTVGLMMGSDKGQQTNGQLYGQQPIY